MTSHAAARRPGYWPRPVRLSAPFPQSGITGRSQAHETLGAMTTVIMRTSEGDMRMMLLLWDATSLKIVEIPIKTTLNNPDFPEK